MQHLSRFVPLMLLALLAGLSADAQMAGSDSVVDASVQWDAAKAHPGDERVLAVILEIEEGYHVNAEASKIPPSESWLIPTAIELSAERAGAVAVGPTRYPPTHEIAVDFLMEADALPVYEGRAIAYIPVTVPPTTEPGELALSVKLTIQACDDKSCLTPSDLVLPATLTVVPTSEALPPVEANPDIFGGYDAAKPAEVVNFYFFNLDPTGIIGLAALLLVAAVGGLLLNATPCVLPVIPIKVMSLSQTAGSRGRTLILGLAMTAGVVGFWLAIGGLIASITGFDAVNKLFQWPAFTIGVGVVIAVMAVGMCGVFSLSLPAWVYSVSPKQESIPGSFGFGVMTAVLSTPCTAPFMGAAAAWATLQPAAVTLATFAAIGVGMASPYLLLAAFPRLVARVPRTGPGSELLKQVMGLFMLAAAAYFVGVGISTLTTEPPQPPSLAYWWAVALLVAAAAGWLVVRIWKISGSPIKRTAWTAVGLAVIAGAGLGATDLTDRGPIDWVYYTPAKFDEALSRGDVVVMDFTAEWCLNCKALEHRVLNSDAVSKALNADGVTPIKVDITSGDNVVGREMLAKTGRVTIPLLTVYAPDGGEAFKADFYTAKQVLDAIEAARGSSAAAPDSTAAAD
jgi:thiol:disulfide interchange protein DsbD